MRWIVLLLLLVPGVSRAATWTVEKDGSGDFTVVQDAIDAAAPGDTILIGPGRFEDFRPGASTADGTQFSMIAYLGTPGLTITGAGRDQTFLGPETPTAEVDGLPTGSVFIDEGATGTTIQSMQIENTRWIVTIRPQSVMENCRIENNTLTNAFAVTLLEAPDVLIRTTEFLGADAILTGFGTSGMIVEDCTFHDESQLGTAIAIGNAAQNCTVRRCTFTRGGGGIQFGLGGTGVVEDCVIKGMEAAGIDLSQGSAIVRRCKIGPTRFGIRANIGSIEVYDTVIEGGTTASLASWCDVLIRGSHILNVGGPSVRNRAVEGELVDVRSNWWGTTDTTQIESWIDDPNGTAIWSPIAEEPIPNDDSSVSELKGRFLRNRLPHRN